MYLDEDSKMLITVCVKCFTKSKISASNTLSIAWGDDDQNGVLCGGWSK